MTLLDRTPRRRYGRVKPRSSAPPPVVRQGEPAAESVPSRAGARLVPVMPVLVTLCSAVVATFAAYLTWQTFMGTPWTRDGRVRVYVVDKASEIEGVIVSLPIHDNQFVHKGDVLMEIDPRNYRVAVDVRAALVDQATADFNNKQLLAERRMQLTDLAATPEERDNFSSSAKMAAATLQQRQADLDQARINLERTTIRSSVNGWVTNLLVQVGDYADKGQKVLSVIDADSFWVDGYFEETVLAPVKDGDPARVQLLGYPQVVDGHVESVARGVNVANAAPDEVGLANVNPVFTWVRLAQRVPVRIHLDHVPAGVRLVAGMTATVEVDPRGTTSP